MLGDWASNAHPVTPAFERERLGGRVGRDRLGRSASGWLSVGGTAAWREKRERPTQTAAFHATQYCRAFHEFHSFFIGLALPPLVMEIPAR
jgi:hypothetical protein